jgi:hypothetical protein
LDTVDTKLQNMLLREGRWLIASVWVCGARDGGRHAHEEVFRKWVREAASDCQCAKRSGGRPRGVLVVLPALFWHHLRVVGGMWEAFFRDSV